MRNAERNSAKSNCINCTYYKKKMCTSSSPQLTNKPFGFPLRYDTNKINCHSWKEKTLDDDIHWEHL